MDLLHIKIIIYVHFEMQIHPLLINKDNELFYLLANFF